MSVKVLKSAEDASVNFVFSGDYPGFFEARYVRRFPEYFAVYLSSQSGCAQGCRMCHLTATKQTKAANATPEIYLKQAEEVFRWYDANCPMAKIVHFNFMARGEAMDNEYFLKHGSEVLYQLGLMATKRNLIPRFLISTILPKSLIGRSLSGFFPVIHPEIYYSIYSVNEEFRKKWLPKAMPVDEALCMLKEYQENTKQIIKLHWAFIEGENDSEEDVVLLCHKIRSFIRKPGERAQGGLRVDIANVRYNPYSEKYGRESSEEVIRRNLKILELYLPFSRIKTISRVGPDVKASCGMFVEPDFS